MNQIRQYFTRIVTVLALAIALAAPAALAGNVSAQTGAKEVCAGIATASGAGCSGSNKSLNRIVAVAVNIFSIVVGIVAVIMIMVSGFKYITAGGDSGKIGSAKSTLTYAIIGLVIVALAQTIVRFVLDAAQ